MKSTPADHKPALLDNTQPPGPARTARTRPGPATRQTSLILGPVSTAPRCARGTLHEALTRWGLDDLSEPGQAITSELVTNAIAASIEKPPKAPNPAP